MVNTIYIKSDLIKILSFYLFPTIQPFYEKDLDV